MPGWQFGNSTTRYAGVFIFVTLATLLCSGKALARPDLRPLGPNMADKGSAFYHFEVVQFDSVDGKRHYRVWTGIPNSAPPPAGYPILYMLDGNAVMDRLSDPLLQKLSANSPPVIVAIGYQTALPFDLQARAYDYTALVSPSGAKSGRGGDDRRGGGNLVFRQLLEQKIVPHVEGHLAINPARRGLWGHSYGGVFVVDSWISGAPFTFFSAASPSLGRDNGALLARMDRLDKTAFCTRQLVITEGTGDERRDSHAVSGSLSKVTGTIDKLHADGIPATLTLFPGLSHGPMFNAGFERALLDISAADFRTAACGSPNKT